jgi:hypothetical protein
VLWVGRAIDVVEHISNCEYMVCVSVAFGPCVVVGAFSVKGYSEMVPDWELAL